MNASGNRLAPAARRLALAMALLLGPVAQGASSQPLTVQDDAGRALTLRGPAQRVITVAPHATELVYAAGGGAKLVGADRYSNYPPSARELPRVGDGLHFDLERVLALKPDLLVLWAYGDGVWQNRVALLEQLGIAVYYSNPRRLADIPEAVARLGAVLGTEPAAQASAARLARQLEGLTARYRDSQPIRVFYQLGKQPIYTVNDRSIIGDALRVCGAVNVFAGLPITAPMVNAESVLLKNPQAIIVGQAGAQGQAMLKDWEAYAPGLSAAEYGNLWTMDPDAMHRPGPRLVEATAQLCGYIDEARRRIGAAGMQQTDTK